MVVVVGGGLRRERGGREGEREGGREGGRVCQREGEEVEGKTILIMGRRKRERRKKVDGGLVAGWRRERASTLEKEIEKEKEGQQHANAQ